VKRFVCLVIIILSGGFIFVDRAEAQNDAWAEGFFKANQAYKENRFQEAVDGYKQLAESGHKNGHLCYNLGNAYFRLNELGRAILYYERARLLIPRDADLNFNLRHAGDRIQDAVPRPQAFLSMTFFWLNSLTLDELFWGFVILNILFWGILFSRLFFRSEWTYYIFVVFMIVWFIAGISFGLKWYQVKTDNRAVILEPEVSVMAGPDIQDTLLFKLHAGTIVDCERSEDGWHLIHLSDKKRGWVVSKEIEKIIKD